MSNNAVLEINTVNLRHNLQYFRGQLDAETKIMVMVKAFGYGLGNPDLSLFLEQQNVDYLGVAFINEGADLRKAGIKLPIMAMNPHPALFETAVSNDLEMEIYSMRILKALDRFPEHSKIHLKLETGMNRLGFEKNELEEVIGIIKNNKRIHVTGILSHLSSAELENELDYTLQQIKSFRDSYELISGSLGYRPIAHILNTAGTTNIPEHQFDMVRLGIGVFGIDLGFKHNTPLKVVCSLTSEISQIKTLNKGETVGYDRKGLITKDDTRIATISMGYADGIFRKLGNGIGKVWVKGHLAPTVGNICMDMFMIDVTGIDVEEGETVEIFGSNQPVEDVANTVGTIPYEIFTSVGERVERRFI